MFKVLTTDSDWLRKGYMNSKAEMWFEDECTAQVYLGNWLAANNGWGKIEYDEWIEKEKPLQAFPLKIGLPIIVNSRNHLSQRTKDFSKIFCRK